MQSLNIVFTGKNCVEVREEAVPALGSGQILVQVEKSIISSGTECICLKRDFAPGTHWDNWVKYPFSPGYSAVGRVVEVADDAQQFQPGERVALTLPHRQYHVCSADSAFKVPAGISSEDAAWFMLTNIAQNGVRRAQHELGDTCVVIGLGVLGQLVTQFLRVGGAREIIAIDTSQERLKLAKENGATHVMNLNVADAKDAVETITQGRLADVVYDITGHPDVLEPALGLVRTQGKLLLLGDTGTPSRQHLSHDLLSRSLRIIGAHTTSAPQVADEFQWWTNQHMTELFFDYVQRGQMNVNNLVTHRYRPQEATEAYRMLMTDRASAMGVIFDWAAEVPDVAPKTR